MSPLSDNETAILLKYADQYWYFNNVEYIHLPFTGWPLIIISLGIVLLYLSLFLYARDVLIRKRVKIND